MSLISSSVPAEEAEKLFDTLNLSAQAEREEEEARAAYERYRIENFVFSLFNDPKNRAALAADALSENMNRDDYFYLLDLIRLSEFHHQSKWDAVIGRLIKGKILAYFDAVARIELGNK